MYWRSHEPRCKRPLRRGGIHVEFVVILPALLTVPLAWIVFGHSTDVLWWFMAGIVWVLAAIYPLWRVSRT